MSWSKGFVGQFRDPVTEIIVTRRDEASPRAIEGMSNGEGAVAAVA